MISMASSSIRVDAADWRSDGLGIGLVCEYSAKINRGNRSKSGPRFAAYRGQSRRRCCPSASTTISSNRILAWAIRFEVTAEIKS